MAQQQQNSIEATRTRVARRNMQSGSIARSWVRGMEGQALTRIVRPADGKRAALEAHHKVSAHYRLRDAEGRYLRCDCEGVVSDVGAAWIGTEAQLEKVLVRFPLANGMRPSKMSAKKITIPVKV